MFKRFKTLEENFQQTRLVSMVAVGVVGVICAICMWGAFEAVEKANGRVYVLVSERAFEAVASDPRANLEVECKGHLRHFHELFFDLDPDNKQIEASMNLAFYLGDGTVRQLYNDMKESGYIAGLIAGSVTQSVEIDSLWVDIRREPYPFRCVGKERLVRSSTVTTRSLVTQGYLRKVHRSEMNEHGLLIEKFEVVENKNLKTENRVP
jgi:conjugative transposon TraK protein